MMWLRLALLLSSLLLIASWKVEEIPEKYAFQFRNLQITNSTKHLEQLYKNTQNVLLHDSIFCTTCTKTVNEVLQFRKNNSKAAFEDYLKKICYSIMDNHEVCDGYISLTIETVLYIIDNKPNLTPERICAIHFQYHNCHDPNANNWTINIPPVPANLSDTNRIEVQQQQPLKILHLTDFHYDPFYKPGSNADCGEDLCCQNTTGPPNSTANAAGFWGDYHACDMPWHSFINLMDRVTSTHGKFDYVYFTGDVTSHKVWPTSKEDHIYAMRQIYELFGDRFNGTLVVPILGNHEAYPTDFYSPLDASQNISTHWVFEVANKEWSTWLTDEAKKTINAGGYYTLLIRPGFRVIVLNSNVCYTSDLWLIYDDVDTYGQLQWLVDVLMEAERNQEKVHILSHVPPGQSRCLRQWLIQYRRIVNRFAKTISAQFNGHTHVDEFRLFYDLENKNKVINVAFNGGSFTTFIGMNPNYRIYTVDANNLRVLDYDHFTYNMTKANLKNSKPDWYKLYSFKDAYGVKSMDYDDLDDLVKRMGNDQRLLTQYFRFAVRESDPKLAQGCNQTCLQQLLCEITSVEVDTSLQCEQH